MRVRLSLLAAALLAGGALAGSNPAPAEDDFILPMPGGEEMVFRPVWLDVGDAPFAGREFKMGDRAGGGFQEYPTTVVLGGSFRGMHAGRADWLYYTGKYEVTEAQWDAVMQPDAAPRGDLPVRDIAWHQMQEFIHRYNLWLYAHALDRLPGAGKPPAFVRLPSEIEWEFAARGGAAVSANAFDRTQPYGTALARHEWFAGPESSHHKVRPIGQLLPNALGLHDMLGNISEMTGSAYQVEYYQGRRGGIVVRGGDVFTPKPRMRSSLRSEQPIYGPDLQPAHHPTIGFRLALGAVVYDEKSTATAMAAAWESYRKSRRVALTAADSTAPRKMTDTKRMAEITALVARLEIEATPELRAELTALKASLTDVQAAAARAEAESAGAWVRIAGNTAYLLSRDMAKVRQSQMLLELTEKSAPGDTPQRRADLARHEKLLESVEQGWSQYGDAIRQLQKLDPVVVEREFAAFEAHVAELKVPRQTAVVKLAMQHWRDFAVNLRVDVEGWGDGFRQVWQE